LETLGKAKWRAKRSIRPSAKKAKPNEPVTIVRFNSI